MKDSTSPTIKATKGYKLTGVGLIPEDWEVKPLREVAQIRSGIAKNSNALVADPILVHYLRVANVQDGFLDLSEISRIAISRGDLNRFSVLPGDVLMNEGGDLDKLARGTIWNGEFTPCIHQNHVFVVRCGPTVEPVYLTNWSAGAVARRYFLVAGKQTTNLASINKTALGGLPVAVPNTTEQRAIAEALSDVDGLIGALEKLIAKKQAIKQASMQQLLTGKIHLPGFTGKWEMKRLGDVVERFVGGGTPSRANPAYWGNEVPWVTVKDFATFDPFQSQEGITKLGLLNSATNLIPAGTLITSTRMALGRTVVYKVDVTINQDLKAVLLKPDVTVEFLLHWFAYYGDRIDDLGSGSTVKGISVNELKHLPVSLPEKAEQIAIATVLSDMEAEIATLEHRRNKTRQIKQGMMQQLLTGCTRLVKPQQAPTMRTDAKSKENKPHSWAFNEAVVISTLAKHFGKEAFPLGRKRYTKLSYLLHRYVEKQTEGYLKKAAGPYNPKTKYGGPEQIAVESGYLREHKHGPYSGFIVAENIAQAEGYFEKWYGKDAIQWLEQFRFKRNDDLELLATVDMAAEELRAAGKVVDVPNMKTLILGHLEWRAKLDREIFSDVNILRAIRDVGELFAEQG